MTLPCHSRRPEETELPPGTRGLLVKKLLLLLLLIGGILAGGAWWFGLRQGGSSAAERFTVARVEYGRLSETLSATGVVQPRQLYTVGSETSGRVVEVLADFNQEVAEGEVLVRVDDQAARQQRDQAATAVEAARVGVKQAQSARDTARKVLERERARPSEVRREIEVEVLAHQLATTDAALEGASIKVRQAEQALALAELALSHTVIRAPVLKAHAGASPSVPERPGLGALNDDVKHVGPRKFLV